MTSIARADWVKLYKQLHREAEKFTQYNYRSFAHRRIRDHFEKNKTVIDIVQLQNLYKEGQRNLESLRRQTVLSSLYPHQKTVVEEQLKH